MVPVTMVSDPSQSMALRPARRGVLGVSMSRYRRIMIKARPSKGTGRRLSVWTTWIGEDEAHD